MMTTTHRTTNSYKLFLSYFLVFLIPTILISVIVFSISNHILKKEIQTNNILTTQTGQYNLDQTLESFNIIGTSIAYSNFGHSIDLKKENTTATQLISFLNRSNLSYSFVQDIFLIYNDGDYIYSSQSSYTEDNFYKYLRIPGYTPTQLKEMFREPVEPFILSVPRLNESIYELRGQKDYILYTVPCTRSDYTIGSVAFLIDIELLNKFLGNIDSDHYTYLIDENNTILNPNNTYTTELTAFLQNSDLKTISMDDTHTTTSSRTHTFISGSIIPSFLYLVNISSNEKALYSLNTFRNLTFFILFIAFILGIVCVMIAFKKSYRDWIDMTDSYEEELKKILPLKQKEVLYGLIEGNYIYFNDFAIHCEEANLDFNAIYHYCVIVQPKNNLFEIEHYLSSMTHTPITFKYNYCTEKSSEKIIYLLGTQTEISPVSHFYDTEECVLFISKPVYNILDIHLQYTDIMSLMYMHQFSKSPDNLEETSTYTKRIHHYESLISQVNTCHSTSDIKGLTTLKEVLMNDLKTDFIPFEIKIKILLQLFMLLSKTIKITFEINNILEITSIETLEKYIGILFDTYIQSIEIKKDVDSPSLSIENIHTFIEEHFTDPMFSLQLIADHYNVSNSYLSWYFKQKTGITILDYTTNLKMNLAIQLLKQNHPLQEIALQIGYINVSSFIRRFKQTMGMTPGEYKKNINL